MKLESTVKCSIVTIPIEGSNDVCEPVWLPLLQTNGTDKPQIVPSKKSQISDGTEKTNGSVTSHRVQPINLLWKNISYTVQDGRKKSKKTILKDVSGKAFPGELTAIMGPSGSGKSTLLNILSSYVFRNVSGEILMNGNNKYANNNLFSYIMQDDLVLPYLTVKEMITIAAHLKLPENVSSQEKVKIVDELINTLGLTDCENTMSNNLSGGERKRLCIAQELVSNPPVLLLDEPTSGLDSQTCLRCITLMKKLTERGHTVICSIHQPSANLLNMFDKLFVLSEGECIYKGTVPELLPFLSSYGLTCPQYHNPADFVIEIASGTYGDKVDQLKLAVKREETPDRPSIIYIQNETLSYGNTHKSDEIEYKKYASSPWTQFKVITCRTYKTIYRDLLLTQLRFAMHAGLGLLIGLLYWKVGNDASLILNNSAFLFFTMLFLLFTSIMPTVITFPREMRVYLREHHNNWHRSYIYYLAKTIIDLPFQIAFTLIYCVITYWMTDQPSEFSRFALFSFNCCLLSAVSQSVGIISASISTVEVAVFVAPTSAVPVILFSNFFLKLNQMPVYLRWLSYLSYFRYNYQIIMQTIYGYNRPDLKCDALFCPFVSPQSFMEAMDVENSVVWQDVLALLAFFVIIRGMGYIFLLWKIHTRE